MDAEPDWSTPIVSEKVLRELRGAFINRAIACYLQSHDSQDPKEAVDGQGQITAYADAIARVHLLYEPHRTYDDCWEDGSRNISAGIRLHQSLQDS